MFRWTELFADVADVDINDAVEWAKLAAENRLGELFTRDDLTGLPQKQFQQREFNTGQIEGSLVQRSLAR